MVVQINLYDGIYWHNVRLEEVNANIGYISSRLQCDLYPFDKNGVPTTKSIDGLLAHAGKYMIRSNHPSHTIGALAKYEDAVQKDPLLFL